MLRIISIIVFFSFLSTAIAAEESLKYPSTIPCEPVLKKISSMEVIGLRDRITMPNNTILQLWENLMKDESKIIHRTGNSVGLCFMDDDPESESFTAIVAHVVSKVEKIPEEMIHHTVPAGEYLVFTHRGKFRPNGLSITYGFIYNTFLPQSEYEPNGSYEFEWYEHPRFKGTEDPETEIDIYIPIQKKK